MSLSIREHEENYAATIIKLPATQKVDGLDNLVQVVVYGNRCLIGKNSIPGDYLYFGPETQLSPEFLKKNNLYRHSELNEDTTQKGFFEDHGRVKTIKFKGVISSGFVIPLASVMHFVANPSELYVGATFHSINGIEICRKYIPPQTYASNKEKNKSKQEVVVDKVVDKRMAPEHLDTSHLSRNLHKVGMGDTIVITNKMHGTSGRVFHTLTYRKLSWCERILKYFGFKIQDQEYNYVAGSRRTIKSVGFDELPGKQHFYKEDCWTRVCKEQFAGKLNYGEGCYFEIVGRDFTGAAIQKGYTYGFEKPMVYIYRITNINPQGVEIDLPYEQMKERAKELGVQVVPEIFVGDIYEFILKYSKTKINHDEFICDFFKTDEDIRNEFFTIIQEQFLDKPDMIDPSVATEGIIVRIDRYPTPECFKAKSPLFLLHETKVIDSGEATEEI